MTAGAWVRRSTVWSNLVSYEIEGEGPGDPILGRVDRLRGGAGWVIAVPAGMRGVVYDTAEEAEAEVERALEGS